MEFDDALSRVAWQDFEVLVANHYRDLGFDVRHCGAGRFGRRHGSEVDLRLLKDGQLTLVLCRHQSVSRVHADDVARLLATAAEDNAAGVIVISSAHIPDAARQVGEAAGATLIDGVAVRAMLGERLADLHPVRSLPGVDAQHGEAHVVIRSDLRRRKRARWWLWLMGLAALALLVYYAPVLKRLAGSGTAPAPASATTAPEPSSTTEQLPLPPPPAN
jgi:hypothetical protein